MNSQNRARGSQPFIALASVLCLLSGSEVWAGPGETTSGIGGSGVTSGIGGSRLERDGRSGIGGSGFSRFRMDQRFGAMGGMRTSGIGGSGISRMGMRRGGRR